MVFIPPFIIFKIILKYIFHIIYRGVCMKYIKNYLFSIFIFYFVLFLLLLISSLIFAYTNIDDRYITTFNYVCIILSSFLSSFFLCKKIKKKGILHGILINILCIFILFGISCYLNKSFNITNTLGFYILISAICGSFGGILGVNV